MDELSYGNIWRSLGVTLLLTTIGMLLVRHSEEAMGLIGFAGVIFGLLLLNVLDWRELRGREER